MAGKMNDDAGAAKDAGLAKLHDGPAQQRFRDHGPDGSVNTRFIEPKQLRMLAVMSVEHLDDLLAQSVPMTGIQDDPGVPVMADLDRTEDRKSTRLNSSHSSISYAVFCLKKK